MPRLLLIANESHLRRVLGEFIVYYNARKLHQGIEQQSPIPRSIPVASGVVNRRSVLGGIINDYFRAPEARATYLT